MPPTTTQSPGEWGPEQTWLRCGTVMTGHGEETLHDVAVGIADGRIAAVRPWADLEPAQRATARDLGDSLVTPGFIDAHVHLLFTCEIDHERTRTKVEGGSAAALAATAVRNGLECLLGGVTTVRDCGDTRGIVAAVRDAQRDGTSIGPRILSAGAPLTTTGGHLHWCGNAADSPDEIRKAVRRLCTTGVDLVKIMASGGNMTRESNPLVPQFTAEEMAVAVREAHRFRKKVAAHAQNVASISRCIEAGVDTLEHCLWREPDGAQADPDRLIGLLRGTGTSVVVTMAGIARVLLSDKDPDLLDRTMLAAARSTSPTGGLEGDFAWARALHDAGILVSVASDAGVRFTPFRDFIESMRCTVEGLGVSPAQAVAMSTSHAAEALGIADEVGAIAPGLRADLVVLDPADGGRIGTVRDVYQAGELVVSAGRLIVPPLAPSGEMSTSRRDVMAAASCGTSSSHGPRG